MIKKINKQVLKEKIYRLIRKLFSLDKFHFEKIKILNSVILDIIDFSKISGNKEFVAFLDGKIIDKSLIIDKLIYTEFRSSYDSAVPITHFSTNQHFGSVHSHPSFSNKPSKADLAFFRKYGIVHAIICRPYNEKSITFYDYNGQVLDVEIIN